MIPNKKTRPALEKPGRSASEPLVKEEYMSCRGVHFAITEEQVEKLRAFEDDASRLEYLQEEIEEYFFEEEPDRTAETDKAWDAIHRALTDGNLGYENGKYPLNHLILGGEPMYFEEDYIISLKTPEQVTAVAQAIESVSMEDLKQRYYSIDPDSYGFPVNEEDFEYTWSWFKHLVPFFKKASSEGRYVLFTVDQ